MHVRSSKRIVPFDGVTDFCSLLELDIRETEKVPTPYTVAVACSRSSDVFNFEQIDHDSHGTGKELDFLLSQNAVEHIVDLLKVPQDQRNLLSIACH